MASSCQVVRLRLMLWSAPLNFFILEDIRYGFENFILAFTFLIKKDEKDSTCVDVFWSSIKEKLCENQIKSVEVSFTAFLFVSIADFVKQWNYWGFFIANRPIMT